MVAVVVEPLAARRRQLLVRREDLGPPPRAGLTSLSRRPAPLTFLTLRQLERLSWKLHLRAPEYSRSSSVVCWLGRPRCLSCRGGNHGGPCATTARQRRVSSRTAGLALDASSGRGRSYRSVFHLFRTLSEQSKKHASVRPRDGAARSLGHLVEKMRVVSGRVVTGTTECTFPPLATNHDTHPDGIATCERRKPRNRNGTPTRRSRLLVRLSRSKKRA